MSNPSETAEPTWEELLQREMPPLPWQYVVNIGPCEPPKWGAEEEPSHESERP